jgi:hypothetical protein
MLFSLIFFFRFLVNMDTNVSTNIGLRRVHERSLGRGSRGVRKGSKAPA